MESHGLFKNLISKFHDFLNEPENGSENYKLLMVKKYFFECNLKYEIRISNRKPGKVNLFSDETKNKAEFNLFLQLHN